jgi:nucleotidyltransferase substrate binding protein (TIGR01987 family)
VLHEARDALKEKPGDHLYQIALIASFNFTFELAWKTLKDYLLNSGVEVSLPRDVIKQAFHHELVMDGQVWIEMLDDRNLMSYVYDEEKALVAVERVLSNYIYAIEQLEILLRQK